MKEKAKSSPEEDYPKIAVTVGKLLNQTSMNICHLASHGVRVKYVNVIMYALEGQKILGGTVVDSTIVGHSVLQSLITEIGEWAANGLGMAGAGLGIAALGFVSGGWVLLATASFGAAAGWAYGQLIDAVWKWSEQNYILEPVYAMPDIECIELPYRFRTDWPQPQRRQSIFDHLHPQANPGLPDEFFVGTPANSKNYMGMTGDMGTDWLIRLK